MDNCPIDLKMGKIITIILLSFLLFSCSNEYDDLVMFKYDTEVIAVFAPNGVGDQTNAGLIYKGIVKATDSLNLSFRPIFPLTYEEGAKTIAQLTANNQPGRKRLIISTDPGYSDYLRTLASDGLILDSDSTKLLVIDGDFTHPDVYTVHVPLYGVMYKAGYVASTMSDVKNVRIYIANNKFRYIREGKDGFIDGFSLNKNGKCDVIDLSDVNDDATEGFQRSTWAYAVYAPECHKVCDMVLSLCGETIMGFLRYNREFPGSFYTVGVENDMSVYSSDVPFSCVEHLDKVLVLCITEWSKNRLARHQTFRMDEGWVELVISENYKQMLMPVAEEIHARAIEMEYNYEN